MAPNPTAGCKHQIQSTKSETKSKAQKKSSKREPAGFELSFWCFELVWDLVL
jgi:hypothetical protein